MLESPLNLAQLIDPKGSQNDLEKRFFSRC